MCVGVYLLQNNHSSTIKYINGRFSMNCCVIFDNNAFDLTINIVAKNVSWCQLNSTLFAIAVATLRFST